MYQSLRHLLELIRFSHTLFALPFVLLSGALAWNLPDSPFSWQQLTGITLCLVFARAAAMAFNRVVDYRFDRDNPRTAGRHLPAGLLNLSTVAAFTVFCSLGFVATTVLFLPNRWPLILSIPVLLFLLGYSLAKRFTVWCHYWLSAALMLSPMAAWIAIRGEVTETPALLSSIIFFWVGGFDILYACQDAEFDRTQHLFSIPSRWGIATAMRMALFSHLLTIAALFAFWHFAGMGVVFLWGIVVLAVLLLYEHSLVKPNDLSRVGVAFFNVNAVFSLGLLAVGLLDLWYRS